MKSSDIAAFNTLVSLSTDIACHSSFHPLRTAIELQSKGILDDDVCHLCRCGDLSDDEKRDNIIASVIKNGEPGVFQTFVAILESDPLNTSIANEIKGMLLKLILLVFVVLLLLCCSVGVVVCCCYSLFSLLF